MFGKKTKETKIQEVRTLPVMHVFGRKNRDDLPISTLMNYYDPSRCVCVVTFGWIGGTRTDIILYPENNMQNQVVTPDGVTISVSVNMTNGVADSLQIWSVRK